LMNLIITPSCMLAGCFWPIGVMPEYLQKFANFLPQKWALDAMRKLQTEGNLGSITMEITILLAFAAAFFLIAAYRFSKTNDVKSFV
jgi:ABC-2 type transport system permease protein